MIKATMQWVDIPIVLYTRLPVENQKEARQVHGADEVVRKGPGGDEALGARVISVLRRRSGPRRWRPAASPCPAAHEGPPLQDVASTGRARAAAGAGLGLAPPGPHP